MNARKRKIILVALLASIAGIIFYLESGGNREGELSGGPNIELAVMNKEEKAKLYEPAKEISTPDAFINTPPIEIADLIGKKVILIDFWTYSCINCQRTTPYLNEWHKKYADDGLLIIGIHTPEFEFEKRYENVEKAVKQFGIKYPVVLDNDYSTWQSYKNRYWPHKYLIDIDGFIVYDHIGEGGYEETEQKIQELLEEKRKMMGEEKSVKKEISKPAGAEEIDLARPRSPEVYFGAFRNELLGSGARGRTGEQTFSAPKNATRDVLYLNDKWNITEEYAENKSTDAKIIFRYQAQKVFMVASADTETYIQIYKDGVLIKTETIKDEKLYRLIEDGSWGEHLLEIIIEKPGLKAFTFTFG